MNEQDFVTDDEIDEMYNDGPEVPPPLHIPQQQQATMVPPGAQSIGNINGLPIYPIGLAQASLAPAPGVENLLTRKFGPLPVWGWALTAIGTGVGGYFLWQSNQKKKIEKNSSDDEDDGPSYALPESTGSERGSWGPSRGGFSDQLNKFFTRKGMAEKIKIYDDADEAKKKLKHLSPLINIKCEVAYKPDKDLLRLCKREGLNPILHEDGTIGLYPADKTKRGREWEKYIDLLRDDGQTV